MKLILALIMSIALVGCDTLPKVEENTVVKFKYIVNTIPSELLAVPAPLPKVDPTKDDDKTIGNWLLDGEKRSLEIEGKLRSIKKLQDQRLEELKKLPKDDVIIK
jgi:hypothetical protein